MPLRKRIAYITLHLIEILIFVYNFTSAIPMFRSILITFVCIAVLYGRSSAQQKDVSVHADPRLAMLINKSKPVEKPEITKPAPAPAKKEAKKTAAKIPASRMDDVKRDVVAFVTEKDVPVRNTSKITKQSTEDIKTLHRANMRGATVNTGYKGTGYRVQIYNGTSRDEAMRIKAEFMHNYPGIHSYFSYVAPHYRVKVGDFRRREEAMALFREANGTYKPCMIVPDVLGSR